MQHLQCLALENIKLISKDMEIIANGAGRSAIKKLSQQETFF